MRLASCEKHDYLGVNCHELFSLIMIDLRGPIIQVVTTPERL